MLPPTMARTAALSALILGLLLAGTALWPRPHAAGAVTAAAARSAYVIDMAYPCGLTRPAFCDNFSEGPARAGDRGRGNDLSMTRWQFSRFTGYTNGLQSVWPWVPTTAQHCKTTIYNVLPDRDSFLCGKGVPEPEHWMEAFDDGGSYVWNDAMIRQPFDFTHRVGTIQYGVDNKTAGSHTWWTELWITDQPIPGPEVKPGGEALQPRNGFGIQFTGTCNGNIPLGSDAGIGLSGVGSITVVTNYRARMIPTYNQPCVTTAPDSANLIQVRLSTSHVAVYASDHGSNVLKPLLSRTISLPFSVGYVHFEHVQYNAHKEGVPASQTYHWHDMGFDGPVWPAPRGYDAPDSLSLDSTPAGNGDAASMVNIGYLAYADGRLWNGARMVPPLRFSRVDLTRAASAHLNFSTDFMDAGAQIGYQLNRGPRHTFTVPSPIANETTSVAESFSLPVPLSDLRQGTNTVTFYADPHDAYINAPLGTMLVANVSLEVVPRGTPRPARPASMISCSLFVLMMVTMPRMAMPSDACTAAPARGRRGQRRTGGRHGRRSGHQSRRRPSAAPRTPARTGSSVPPGAIGVIVSRTSASPASVAPGATERLAATITANRPLSNALVTFEVYNSSGSTVYQTWQGPVTFAANRPRTFQARCAVPASQPAGTYTLRVAVLNNGWGALHVQDNSRTTFTVSGSPS